MPFNQYNYQRWLKMYQLVTANPKIWDSEWADVIQHCLSYRWQSIYNVAPEDW